MRLAERNPELLRNLWLELTPERLVLAPLLVGAVVVLSWTADQGRYLSLAGELGPLMALLVLVLWGTRRAGNSLREERLAGTWDAQRLSALSAWQLSLGKLFGATAFAWYLAGCCLLFTLPQRLATAPLRIVVIQTLWVPGIGVLAHAAGVLAALAGNSADDTRRRRGAVDLFSLLILGLSWKPVGFRVPDTLWSDTLHWWQLELPHDVFALCSLAVAVVTALLMLQRRMRSELQERTLPLGWLAFLAVIGVWLGGFLWAGGDALLNVQWRGLQPPAWLAAAIDPWFRLLAGWTAVSTLLAYLCFFNEPADVLGWRRALLALREGRREDALAALPLWLVNAGVAVLLAVLAVALTAADEPALRVLAFAIFLLRDLALMLALTLGRAPRRAAAVPASVLLVLYVLLPLLLWLAGLGPIAGLLNPLLAWGQAPLLLGAALLQMAAALIWLHMRWRLLFTGA